MWNKQQKKWEHCATRVVASSNYGNQKTFATTVTNVLMVGEVTTCYRRYQGNQCKYKLEHWYIRHNNVYCLHLWATRFNLHTGHLQALLYMWVHKKLCTHIYSHGLTCTGGPEDDLCIGWNMYPTDVNNKRCCAW